MLSQEDQAASKGEQNMYPIPDISWQKTGFNVVLLHVNGEAGGVSTLVFMPQFGDCMDPVHRSSFITIHRRGNAILFVQL